MKKLLLVDGNSMLFRAYYATAYGTKMTTPDGLPTNAVFGFANMMQKGIDLVHPNAVLVAFDAGKHTFRTDLYADYKGGRKPAPDDLVPQFAMARDYLDAYHIRWKEMANIEADDLIGTMSKQAADYETTILTSDRDLLQLVDDSTRVLLMKKGLTEMDEMTPQKVKEAYGVTPIQIIDFKGLMGDASDNYPGIPGVGEKTAVKLINTYGSVEEVLAHDQEIKGALGKKIQENHDKAELSKTLATIKRDVDLDFTADECSFQPTYKALVAFFQSLNMRMLASRYEKLAAREATAPSAAAAPAEMPGQKDDGADAQAASVQSTAETRARVTAVPQNYLTQKLAVAVIDDRAPFYGASLRGIALSNGTDSYFIGAEDALKDRALINYLEDTAHQKIGFDAKRAVHVLHNADIEGHFDDDAMIAASLADATLTSPEKIFAAYGCTPSPSYEDVYGTEARPKLADPEAEKEYGCSLAKGLWDIFAGARVKVSEYGMDDLYAKIEMPLTWILLDMEDAGVICDRSILQGINNDMTQRMSALEAKIYDRAGHTFNINSPRQLATVLYDELGLYGGKKRSTSADVLEKYKLSDPIIADILDYRKAAKIQSTYAEGLQKYIAGDGRIHTVFNQCATSTGRLSSSDPNLQNISVRDEMGREVRKAFLPSEGCVLLSSDYHQIELRMLASMAHIDSMMDAFNNNIDVHTKTAMDLFGREKPEDVTPQERRRAKTVNFGIVYGISDFGLAEQLGVSRKEAADFIARYYEKYPGIKTYMDNVVADCEKNGYVTTVCGRRRPIPEVHSSNHQVREFGKRAAMNAPIQGSAADLIKIAMIRIDEAMKKADVRSRLILQVHDELIFDVPEEELEQMKQIVTDGMTHAMKLNVPLTVECASGKSWYEAK